MSNCAFDIFDIYDEEPAIQSAPSEVLENIFRFLDGQSFSIARQVCKTWNEIIKIIQLKKSIWKHFCLREIPENVLEEMLWFKCYNVNDIDWMNTYKRWFLSRMIVKSPYWKKTIPAFCPNPITCVRASGTWIITGHSNGLLCVWNMLNGDLRQSFMCHLKIINDIALVDLLNLGSYYGSEELPWAHHHIITISKDRYIRILSLLEPMMFTDSDFHSTHHTDDLNQIRVFGDKFAVSCSDNTVSLWKMEVEKKPYFHLKVSFLQKIAGPIDYVLSLGFWHDQVQCISHSGKLKVIRPNEDEWIQKKYFQSSYSEGGPEYIIAVTAAYVFRENTIIMLTGNKKIIISVGENPIRHYYLMQTVQTALVSIALYGSILALGGENGKLFLFYVPEEEDLLYLDLSEPNFTLSLSEASIISIDISLQHDSPVIVASSTDNIYVIKWYKEDTPKVKKREIYEPFMGLF